MAQTVKVEVVDDISGEPADSTVTFGLDGRTYEIDLSTENTKALHEALAPFVENARVIGKAGKVRGAKGSSRNRNSDSGAIRQWAQEQGLEVSGRGRISEEIRTQYEAAHAS